MISVNLAYNGYVGLSTDTKPIEDVNNGSRFYEMNTQKSYMFDAEGQQWIEQTAEGGGGGSTGGGIFVATFSYDDNDKIDCDKTVEEIYEAYSAGQTIQFLDTTNSYREVIANAYYIADDGCTVKFILVEESDDLMKTWQYDYAGTPMNAASATGEYSLTSNA